MIYKSWLKEQKEKGTLRILTPVSKTSEGFVFADDSNQTPLLDFSSNDYLALSCHPQVIRTSHHFLDKSGSGAGAARLMSGDLILYHQLEEKIAKLKGQQAALLFGSGYMANCGIIPALAGGRHDVIFSDRLNHASIYDGCMLSRAKTVRFRHNDLNHLEELLKKERGTGSALIVVESIYSMDGDFCPLQDLAVLKEKYDCLLMVDEAHATGVFGSKGAGLIEAQEVTEKVDIAMGTFGKALGSFGAYAAGSKELIELLINRARSFIYSTGLPPAVIGASLASVEIIQKEVHLRRELQEKTDIFKKALQKGGLKDLGPSQIIPVIIGSSRLAVEIADFLRKKGIFVTAVRPPTVQEGTARLRFSITRHLQSRDLEKCASMVLDALGRFTGV